MIGIITAMPQEADLIIEKFNLKPLKKYFTTEFYQNWNITLVVTWIWKTQASIGTTLALKEFNFDKIINIGIAGNTMLEKKSQIWDVFFVNQVVQHDGYLPFEWKHLDYFKKTINLVTYPIEKKFEFNIFHWVCATWDQFIDDENKIKQIKEKFNAHLVDMEGFAIASTARELNQLEKLIMIKAVSDGANKEAITDHEKNLELAMKNSITVLENLITNQT